MKDTLPVEIELPREDWEKVIEALKYVAEDDWLYGSMLNLGDIADAIAEQLAETA